MILKTTPSMEKGSRLAKNDSLNTDDDDSVLSTDRQQLNLLDNSKGKLDQQRTSGTLEQSPSIDFSNDQDDQPSETTVGGKIKKKKQRRINDQGVKISSMIIIFILKFISSSSHICRISEKEENHR